jgi:biotin carboxyl carrier protein
MTDIETIDKVRSEDLQGTPGGAESTGSAAFEADSLLLPTSRSDMTDSAPPMPGQSAPPARRGARWVAWVGVAGLIALVAFAGQRAWQREGQPAAAPALPPNVTVSQPLQDTVAGTTIFLGQFSAVDSVELRAQVGGKLTAISFRDGQIVKKGDPLFTIDPRPFEIRLDQAVAQLHAAEARSSLADAELWRAQQLERTQFGTVENVDQRTADQKSAVAAIETAKAAIRDAQLDLEFSQVASPLGGRIGAHLVSIGDLVGGGREGSGASTLLATIVSLDPTGLDEAARLVIERIAGSDALYHDCEHTALVTLCVQDILRGRRLERTVTPGDWGHAILAALSHDIGYVRGICTEGRASEKQFVYSYASWRGSRQA